MTKEPLTLAALSKDLRTIAEKQVTIAADYRSSYYIPVTFLAIAAGIFLQNIWIGLLIFSFAAYHIVRSVMTVLQHRKIKKSILTLIDRNAVSVSRETLSHISVETIHEPHVTRRRRTRAFKEAAFFHFASGKTWRLLAIPNYYEWSKDYFHSSAGLYNISIQGDEFFLVTLQDHPEIACVYPCKFFILDAALQKTDGEEDISNRS